MSTHYVVHDLAGRIKRVARVDDAGGATLRPVAGAGDAVTEISGVDLRDERAVGRLMKEFRVEVARPAGTLVSRRATKGKARRRAKR
jgi:hypothetical protein